MNDAYFDDAVTAALAARDQRRAERLEILLCDEFQAEIRELVRMNLPTLKNWKIAKTANLTGHQLEFADIEAEHSASGKGWTDLLCEREAEIRQLMWDKIREEFGEDAMNRIWDRLH